MAASVAWMALFLIPLKLRRLVVLLVVVRGHLHPITRVFMAGDGTHSHFRQRLSRKIVEFMPPVKRVIAGLSSGS